ncbi:DUF6985 domain-containing protein [Nocardioides zeae]|uniref:DUF6985 domain-containing protein n=1 Tax=Nocardioides zeae TaxID=1457234 RepID=A0AAJ1U1P1_9ACTN|nr:hypothetical protein [Nocardioides zeae]MDQ1103833.1 hypothetical protein [Nocardioides zeae]
MAEIPGFGTFTLDERLGWLVGDTRLEVPGLGVLGTVVVDDPEADLAEVAAVLRRLTGLPPEFRATLTPFLWAYYSDVAAEWRFSDPLSRPEDVWSQVEIGDELHVVRHGDDWYVDIESSCDWEPEHGLQVVLRDGDTLTKIGPYDGHPPPPRHGRGLPRRRARGRSVRAPGLVASAQTCGSTSAAMSRRWSRSPRSSICR